MRFHPTITYEEYRDTLKAISDAKQKRVQGRSWKTYLILGIVCLALGYAPQVPGSGLPIIILGVAAVVFRVISVAHANISRERCLRAFYAEEQEMLNDQILTVDESGISCDLRNGLATSHHRWQVFISRIEMPDAFLFLPSPNGWVRVPKGCLSSTDSELILQWSSGVPKTDRKSA
jgi:hypothetical protein